MVADHQGQGHQSGVRRRIGAISGRRGHETSTPPSFATRRRCRCGCRRSRLASALDLSDAAGAHPCRFSGGRSGRHHRAHDRTMAVAALRPAIHHREPAGAGTNIATEAVVQPRPGRLYAAFGHGVERDQRLALRTSEFQFHPRHRADCQRRSRAQRHGGSSRASGPYGARVHRLREGQSGKDQHGVGRHRLDARTSRASCSR